MESTQSYTELVHVLRHSFVPSHTLNEELSSFIKPGAAYTAPLLSTRSIVVDGLEYHSPGSPHMQTLVRKESQLFSASKEMFSTAAVDRDDAVVRGALGSAGLRLLFWVHTRESPRFVAATSGLDTLPHKGSVDQIPENYDLYLDIPESRLVEEAAIDDTIDALNEKIAARPGLFSVAVRSIVGHDARRVVRMTNTAESV